MPPIVNCKCKYLWMFALTPLVVNCKSKYLWIFALMPIIMIAIRIYEYFQCHLVVERVDYLAYIWVHGSVNLLGSKPLGWEMEVTSDLQTRWNTNHGRSEIAGLSLSLCWHCWASLKCRQVLVVHFSVFVFVSVFLFVFVLSLSYCWRCCWPSLQCRQVLAVHSPHKAPPPSSLLSSGSVPETNVTDSKSTSSFHIFDKLDPFSIFVIGFSPCFF